MKSEATSESIKSGFRKLKMTVLGNQPVRTTAEQIEDEVLRCSSALEDMSLENNFEHMDEISEIQEKYRAVQQLLLRRNQGKCTEPDFLAQLKRIFSQKEESFSGNDAPPQRENANSSVRASDVSIPDRSRSIDNFFKNKEKEMAQKEASFKRILDSKQFQTVHNDSVASKSISKYSRFSKSGLRRKEEEKEQQLKHIIDEHKKMLGRLQSKIKQEEELNEFEKNLLKEEKNRYLGKIEQLENQIEQLYRDNYRLKEVEKSKASETFQMDTLKEHSSAENAYQPYVIKTRNNDLNVINEKNQIKALSQPVPPIQVSKKNNQSFDYLGSKLEREKPISTNEFFNRSPPNYGLYHEMFPPQTVLPKEPSFQRILDGSLDQHNNVSMRNPSKNVSISSIGQGNHFDTFQMANTLSFVNDAALGESRQMVRMSNATCTRNKVAFFKNSLVLVRDAEIEIAYKRSDMNKEMNKIRIIFYINNKSERAKKANITYEFQNEYFSMQILEKLTQIGPKSQGREVAQVTLISKTDLNAVTDMRVDLGDLAYDLWLPINFIAFKSTKDYRITSEATEMTVVPDRQFASFHTMKDIVPMMYGGTDGSESWAYLYGDSLFGSHTIKVTWREKQVVMETSDKWIDFIGFIVHFFK